MFLVWRTWQGGNDKLSSGQSVSRGATAPQQFQKEGGLN